MYLEYDRKDSTMTTDEQGVNEATAALKGLLGLGLQSTPPPKSAVVDAPTETEPSDVAATTDAGVAKKKRKSNRGKKKPDVAAATTPKEDETEEATPATSTTNPTPKANAKQTKPNGEGKKKKPPKKNNSTGSAKPKESENFAWSAFQSSPDASKLPIPAFLSSTTVASSKSETEESGGAVNNGDGATNETEPSNETEGTTVVTADTTPMTPTMAPSTDSPVPPNETESEPLEPVSTTGVNLAAALAAATPQSPPVYTQPPPYQMSHGAGATGAPTYHMPMFNQRYYAGPQFQGPPGPMMSHAMPYAPPPGYVTIHVQVPPVLLMPGRQMVVTSPAGYPVHVVVPDGIPPGMIIPVHVPAGPPLHMMPPQYNHDVYAPPPPPPPLPHQRR